MKLPSWNKEPAPNLVDYTGNHPVEPETISSEDPHVHQWDLIAKTFIEPRNVTVQGNQEISRTMFTGQTTYLFQCSLCSEFRKETCEGLETTALDRLLDKVDLTGPEYIVRDKGTYVLMKYQTEQAQLPVR